MRIQLTLMVLLFLTGFQLAAQTITTTSNAYPANGTTGSAYLGSGTVGTPLYKFYVGGSVKLFNTGNNGLSSPSLYLSNTTSGARNYYINSSSTGLFQVADSNAGNLTRFSINGSGNIGIGTTNQFYKFDITGAMRIEQSGSNGINSPTIYLSNNSTSTGGKNYYINSDPNGFFRIVDSNATNTTRLMIDASGNVGIGNSAPGAKLEVTGQVKITGGTPGAGKVLTSDANGLASWTTLAGGGTVTSVGLTMPSGFTVTGSPVTTSGTLAVTTSLSGIIKGSGGAFTAATSGVDYSAGTSALATGILKSTTTTGALSIAVAGDFPVLNQNTTGSAGSVSGTNVVTNTNLAQMAAHTFKGNNTAATANATDLTATQLTAELNTFTTTLKGLVPAPGTSNTTDFLRRDGSWATPAGGGSSQWTTAVNGTDIYYNTGKVGIGTSTPGYTLHVNNPTHAQQVDFRITQGDGYYAGLYADWGNSLLYTSGMFYWRHDGQDIARTNTSLLVFNPNKNTRDFQIKGATDDNLLYVNAAGNNIGIGTNSPAYKLDITGSQRILGTIGVGTAPSTNGITVDMASGYVSGYPIQVTGNYGGFSAIRVDNSNAGINSGAGLLMVNNSNNVGFIRMDGSAVTDPHAFPGQLNIQSQQSGIRYSALGAATGNPSHIFYTDYPTTLERFRVDNNGATVSNGSMVSPKYLGGVDPASSLVLQSTSGVGATGSTIKFLVGNNGATEAMRILNNGNLLIGTTTDPGYKLAVGGNIIAEKVRIKLQSAGWPDYVFHSTYELPPLNEVEVYINQNYHLPGVPSAAQVEKEGLDLGDGQAVLLKKIEELTLYMIDMNKKLEKLSAENEMLKKKLEK